MVPAAAYVRMSTDRQDQSISNQLETIHKYADDHGLEIIRTYEDEGVSGLKFERREGLQSLLADVLSGAAEFKCVLVYDVSRWGRFQDADEAAFYEFSCRRAGVDVWYCAEPFGDPSEPLAGVYKSFKRAMAGEYSRNLSNKVTQGQKNLAKQGFSAGSKPVLGIRRQCVDARGNPRKILELHERKSYPTDRIVFVPGPISEQKLVRRIYRLFGNEKHTESQIVRKMIDEKIVPPIAASWNRSVVHRILRSEIYIGNFVYNTGTCKLGCPRRELPPDDWIRVEGIIEPIVDKQLFRKVQRIFDTRLKFSNAEIQHRLRKIHQRYGRISADLIDAEDRFLSSAGVALRFGNLSSAYQKAGLVGLKDTQKRKSRKGTLGYRHYE